jgi:hypothetical protein
MPTKIELWFSIVERKFASTHITNDEDKATALIYCLEPQYQGTLEEIIKKPPATGQYEKLKDELIRILEENDDRNLRSFTRISKISLVRMYPKNSSSPCEEIDCQNV